jgi:hypothetical protein
VKNYQHRTASAAPALARHLRGVVDGGVEELVLPGILRSFGTRLLVPSGVAGKAAVGPLGLVSSGLCLGLMAWLCGYR